MKTDAQGNIIISNQTDFNEYLAKRKNKKLYSYDKDGKLVVDHLAVANVLGKFIELCPMDPWIRKVMILRIGSPLLKQKPMSHMQIAIQIGATVKEVEEMEVHGKIIVGRFLERCSAREAVEKVNRDGSMTNINQIKNTLLNPESPAGEKGA